MTKDTVLIYKARIGVTALVGAVDLVLAIIALFEELNVREFAYLEFFSILEEHYWGGMFLIAAAATFAGFKQYRIFPIAMSVSAGLLLVWGALDLGSTLTANNANIPLTGGILAIAFGVVASFMSQIWNSIMWEMKIKHISVEQAGALLTTRD